MSFWDEIRDGIHALYATNDDFLGGFRDVLPGFLQVNGVPLPTDLILAEMFGGGLNPTVTQDYWTTFGVYLAGTMGGVAQVQAIQSAGRAAQAAGTGQDSMPALIIPNVYRVAIIAHSGVRPVLNVVGVKGTAGGQEAAAAAAVKSGWESGVTSMLNQHGSSYGVTQYVATDLTTATAGQAVLASTGVGGLTGDVSTVAACALIKLVGGTRSRTANGRLYFGPLMESQINSDGLTLQSTTITQLQTAFAAFMANINTAGFPLHVISRKTSTSHAVASTVVESTVATQRRRLR